jgi:hypothetical protein
LRLQLTRAVFELSWRGKSGVELDDLNLRAAASFEVVLVCVSFGAGLDVGGVILYRNAESAEATGAKVREETM